LIVAETEAEIAAPRERVFDLLLDPSRLDDWVTISRGVSDVSEGELAPGSEFRQRMRLGAAAFDVRWRLVELDPPRLAVWEGRGPAGSEAHVRYELADDDAGTRFRYRNEYRIPGGRLGAAAGRVTSGAARRAMRSSLRRLKSLVEA
jgi:uncharacterized protein YndB with AHSA1/START domain